MSSASFPPRAFEIRPAAFVQALFDGQRSIDPEQALPVTRRAWQELHRFSLAPATHSRTGAPWWLDLHSEADANSDTATAASITALFYVAPALPCFAGHFPGQPLLPGVMQLDWAVELASQHWPAQYPAQNFAGLARLKFKAPIDPGAVLAMKLDRSGDRMVNLTISSAAQSLTSARLLYCDQANCD